MIENELRDFRLSGAELPAAEKARFKAIQEELAIDHRRVRRPRARRHQRLRALRRRLARLDGLPPDVIAEARADRAGRRPRRLQAHAAHALLPAGDEVRVGPRAARDDAPRATPRARPTSARSRSGTTRPLIDRVLALRREAAQLLGYPDYAEALARAEDGAQRRRGARVPARPRAAREALRRARLAGAVRVRARPARPREARALGHRLGDREAPQRALRLLGRAGAAVLPRGQGAGRAVPRRRDDLRRAHPRVEGRDLASDRALLRDRRPRRQDGRAVLLRQLRARAQAGRRVDGRRDQPPREREGPADPGRLPDLQPARAGRAASRRCSRTTT